MSTAVYQKHSLRNIVFLGEAMQKFRLGIGSTVTVYVEIEQQF